ncbi:MAG: c-type cytochrome [Planctomycetes bacterium]|nr:c-type cytochrome [Planctomycetota bacterium]
MADEKSSPSPVPARLDVPKGGAPVETEAPAPPHQDAEPAESPDAVPSLTEMPALSNLGKSFFDLPGSDTTLYNIPILNASFAVLSLLLLLLIVWSILQDYNREWKSYQYDWQAYQARKYRQDLDQETSRLKGELGAIEKESAELEVKLAADASLKDYEQVASRAENDALMLDTKAKFFKADMDAAKYVHEEEKRHIFEEERGETPRAKARMETLVKEFNEMWVRRYEEILREAENASVEAQKKRGYVAERTRALTELKSRKTALSRKHGLLQKALASVEDNPKNTIRNLPMLDFFAPSAQIQKVVVQDLTEPMNFMDVQRVDRCKSCHLNIDDPDPVHATFTMKEAVHEGKVYRSHPRLDLFAGSASPHPYLQFGCTICHYGDGHSLTFTTAAHTPENEQEMEEWEKKYRWETMHHQDFLMIPASYATAACAKCHAEQDRIRGADDYNQGRDLVEKHGCFGCHKIEGFEKYRKAGPNLSKIATKVDRRFLYKWIRNPSHFRPTTRMPRFFDLANTVGSIEVIGLNGERRDHDFNRRNGVEALAIATYLEVNSEKRDNLRTLKPGLKGDPARGKEALLSGCLGCHPIQREGFTQNDHGPDLGAIGSKVKPEWLADWLVRPSSHDPKTRMPRLRLEQDENGEQTLADLVAYLLSLRDENFDQAPAPMAEDGLDEADRLVLKDIAYDYARRTATRGEATQQVEAPYEPARSARDPAAQAEALKKADEALLAAVGQSLIQRYGCFGCHEGIKGFENAQPIGTELSEEGNKAVDRLDFALWGFQPRGEFAFPHTRIGWFTHKLQNTRLYDMVPARKVDKEGHVLYEPSDRRIQKSTEELLKMPLFPFHDDPAKVHAIVTFLLSLVREPIPASKKRVLKEEDKAIEEGRNLARFYNCQGCHRIGTDVKEVVLKGASFPRFSFDDPDELQERNEIEKETWLAEELKLDPVTVKSAEGKEIRLDKIVFPAGTLLSQKYSFNGPKGEQESSVVEIVETYWNGAMKPERDRVLKIHGYDEGRMRLYLGKTGEDRAKAPPLLRLEGDRTDGNWLFNFLLDVKPLRPWLTVRMPSYDFTPDAAARIVAMFKGLSRTPYPHEFFPEHVLDEKLARQGKEMFKATQEGDQQKSPPPLRLGCQACHPAGSQKPSNPDPNNWGPDLGLARERLRPTWVRAWLINPKFFMPGTKMPNNWLDENLNYSLFRDPGALSEEERQQIKETLSLEDRQEIESILPFIKYIGIQEYRPNWREEMDSIIQYLMHMKEVEKN